jgi:hypothetical protein
MYIKQSQVSIIIHKVATVNGGSSAGFLDSFKQMLEE